MNKHILLIILTSVLILGCSSSSSQENRYSFFVAGHVYGFPGEPKDNIGVHPPFKNKLNIIKNNELIEFGVLTGDIVENGKDEKEWDELDADMLYINKKVYMAPGNHDVGNSKKRAVFKRRYGDSYYSFKHKNDLIIILDPNIDKWNISGKQLNWLKNIVSIEATTVDNIFVFFHQVLWWEKDNIFKSFRLNSQSGRGDIINFWTEIYPLFEKTNKAVFMFAGDTGVYDDGFMYYKESNVSFIASGMGGRKEDNFIIVNVNNDKSVEFKLIALNGDDLNGLGKLKDYVLP